MSNSFGQRQQSYNYNFGNMVASQRNPYGILGMNFNPYQPKSTVTLKNNFYPALLSGPKVIQKQNQQNGFVRTPGFTTKNNSENMQVIFNQSNYNSIQTGKQRTNFYNKEQTRKNINDPFASNSYNIINNNPYNKTYGTNFNGYKNNSYSQRKDHITELLNYTNKQNGNYLLNTGNLSNRQMNYGTYTSPEIALRQKNRTISVDPNKININNYHVENSNYNNQQNLNPNYNCFLENKKGQLSNDVCKNEEDYNPRNNSPKTNFNNNNNMNSNINIKTIKPDLEEAKNLGDSKEKFSNNELNEYYETCTNLIKEFAYKEDANLKYRDYMEDKGKYVLNFNNDPNNALFCLFDGHGGGEVSKFLQENFALLFKEKINNNYNIKIEDILTEFFEELDLKIKERNFYQVGSTCCIIYITIENSKRVLYCANIGDTRSVLTQGNGVKRLSFDDRASDKDEYDRIVNGGGIVFAGRVCGQLMLSRAFGDWELKPYGVISTPHVTRLEIQDNDKYVIMGSDGIWDVIEDLDAYSLSLTNENAKELCNIIVQNAIEKGTMDNLSCFVIKLN